MDCLDRIFDNVFKSSDEDGCFDLSLDDEALWLDNFMNVPLLNDGSLTSDFDTYIQSTDGSTNLPHIDAEHSYSSQANVSHSLTDTYVSSVINDQELDSTMMTMVDPNLAMSPDFYTHSSNPDQVNMSDVCEEEIVMSSHDYGVTSSQDHDVTSSLDYDVTSSLDHDVMYSSSNDDDVHSSDLNSEDGSLSGIDQQGDPVMQDQVYTLSVDPNSNSNEVMTPSIVLTYQPTTRLIKRPTIIVTKNIHPYAGAAVVARNRLTEVVHCADRSAGCRVVKVLGQSGKQVSIIRAQPQQIPEDNLSFSQEWQNDESANLPPSPPGSDNEGLSPKRYTVSPTTQVWTPRGHGVVSLLNSPTRSHISSTGRLVLTEEERRTLIAEGYPVPTRLPLTKQEENNLKKIQRKIKNKMSAQESRRKKKDYLDLLEKKLEISNQENGQLKKQLESLQSDNRSMQTQINKLQSLANKLKPSVETSTCVMVLALFFAMFASTFWIPAALTAGRMITPWSGTGDNVASALSSGPIAVADDYRTPNIKSRTLMSMIEDSDDSLYKSSCRGSILDWLTKFTCSHHMAVDCTHDVVSNDDQDDDVLLYSSSTMEGYQTLPIGNLAVVTGRQELYIAVENDNMTSLINTADVIVLTNSRAINGTHTNEIRTLPV